MSGLAPVPSYVTGVAGDFVTCAPGHRFNLYFPVCDRDWTVASKDGAKSRALGQCTRKLPAPIDKLLDSLRARQRALAACHDQVLFLPAVSSAPFATGLGIEHPSENGFAFLTPYGLPYLPGSGVKGVLRRAAEELAVMGDPETGQPAGFDLLDLWWLFGFEGGQGLLDNPELQARVSAELSAALGRVAENPDLVAFARRVAAVDESEAESLASANGARGFVNRLEKRAFRATLALRGALSFWDVFPEPRGKALCREIMTPHYTDYYQGKGSPHDAGQPNPIPFLAVPAGSSFDFHVVCEPERLPRSLHERWKPIMERVFSHAFDWLGFGAKTAVGYGQVELDVESRSRQLEEIEQNRRAQEEAAALERALAGLPDDAKEIEQWRRQGRFENSGTVLDTLAPWLANRDSLSPEAAARVHDVLESRWKGITGNPDATQGKRGKPKFKPRPVALAKRFLEIVGKP